MPNDDWLIGSDRHALASKRIYAAATQLIARNGWDDFDLDALAAKTHCSRATLYRHVGSKAQIRESVLAAAGGRITEFVRQSVEGLSGRERVVTAILVALERVRSDQLSELILHSLHQTQVSSWLIESPMLDSFANELCGVSRDDSLAAQWIVRVFLSLLTSPVKDATVERELLLRFVAPVFQVDD
jgi:AcrR family transcriptional regulator